MRYLLFFVFCICYQLLQAQIKPDFFPEDVSKESVEIRCFCKPGVRNKSRSKGLEIAYDFIGKGAFQPEDGQISPPLSTYSNWQRWEFDLKVPVLNKENFNLLLGYQYTPEYFTFKRFGNDFTETFRQLDKATLKSSSWSAIISKPLNETRYLAIRLRYSANGDYNGIVNFQKDNAIYKGLALYGIKPHDDFEWGIGLNVSKSFRQWSVLPFFVYNRTYENGWGIEAAFPGYVFGRKNLNTKSIFLFGYEYNSNSYRVNVPIPNADELRYAINHSEIILLARLERELTPWVWANLRLGYQLNFSTNFEAKSPNTTYFEAEPNDAPFIEIGIFLSPPDGFLDN